MTSHPIIEQQVIDTKVFQNVSPKILNSGEVGFFYLNTEKLARDNGAWKEHKNNSLAMYNHAVQMTKEHSEFAQVIDILTDKAQSLIDFSQSGKYISGGQTRDWLFSTPVAHRLKIPHISIYKNGKVEIISPDLERVSPDHYKLENAEALHIVDLLTKASSCYRVDENNEAGWVPSLWDLGLEVNHLITVVDRMQGGMKVLSDQGIKGYSFLEVDKEFLGKHSENPERDLAYSSDPKSVVVPYLQENGALAFVDDFNPDGDRVDKAKRFLQGYEEMPGYEGVLRQAGRYDELDKAVQDKFGKSIEEIVGEVKK